MCPGESPAKHGQLERNGLRAEERLSHAWVLVKFLLTLVGTAILLGHMRRVSQMSAIAAETLLASGDHGMLRTQLVVHAAGGLVVLLTATVLSVFKPWGRTRYGRCQRHAS